MRKKRKTKRLWRAGRWWRPCTQLENTTWKFSMYASAFRYFFLCLQWNSSLEHVQDCTPFECRQLRAVSEALFVVNSASVRSELCQQVNLAVWLGWTLDHMTIRHLRSNDTHTSAFLKKLCLLVQIKRQFLKKKKPVDWISLKKLPQLTELHKVNIHLKWMHSTLKGQHTVGLWCIMYSAFKKTSHHTNKPKLSCTPDPTVSSLWALSRPLHLCLSLLIDNNRPYILFVIDDRSATFHLWPLGAALTSNLTSWDSCNDTGIRLMTPWAAERSLMKGHEQMSHSRGDLRKELDLLINWLDSQLGEEKERRKERLEVCYQRLQVTVRN